MTISGGHAFLTGTVYSEAARVKAENVLKKIGLKSIGGALQYRERNDRMPGLKEMCHPVAALAVLYVENA